MADSTEHDVGHLDVLSTGHGDIRLRIDESDEEGIEKARKTINDMLERGYSIFVERKDGSTSRVKRFDKRRLEYIIEEPPDEVAGASKPKGKPKQKRVPATKSKATAVGRTAGG